MDINITLLQINVGVQLSDQKQIVIVHSLNKINLFAK